MGVLRMLHRLGVRYLTLTHNYNVPWADSATDEPVIGGLSVFGRAVVRELQRLGMLVDLSHVAADTARDALQAAEAPVIFSHSCAQALCDHPRNVPDDVLARLRDNGGICMVAFVPGFVSAECRGWEWATVAQVADHVEHVRAVAGVEHVGLGADYDGTDRLPDGLQDVSCYPALFAELRARGWSEQDRARLAGGNLLRVLRAAEAAAAMLSARRAPALERIEELDRAAHRVRADAASAPRAGWGPTGAAGAPRSSAKPHRSYSLRAGVLDSVTHSSRQAWSRAFAQSAVAPIRASPTPRPRADGRTHMDTTSATPSRT